MRVLRAVSPLTIFYPAYLGPRVNAFQIILQTFEMARKHWLILTFRAVNFART